MDKIVAPKARLSVHEIPQPHTEVISDALIAPMEPGRDMACGVFRADGSFCDHSKTLLSAKRFTGQSELPRPKKASQVRNLFSGKRHLNSTLRGRYLFAGIGRHHFGHFLLESITRLWPLETDTEFDGIILVPRYGMDLSSVFKKSLGNFVDLLSGGLPVHFATQPVRVETLVVPTQGIGHRNWTKGTEPFRKFVRNRIENNISPEGPELLYVSRTGLTRQRQMVDQEDRIEQMVQHAGYEVFHPQRHSLALQCARYMAARHILGPDGSAFHLAPFALRKGTTVGLIRRRNRPGVFEAIADQIRAFCDVDLVTLEALVADINPGNRSETVSRIDFDRLKLMLEEAGLV